MTLFGKSGISRPTPAAPSVAVNTRAPYKSTNIQIVGAVLPPNGDYYRTVCQHLDDIASFPVGQQLLQALQQSGKTVVIIYAGPNGNQAAGSAQGYVLLRYYHDNSNTAALGTELGRMITASGKSVQTIAGELYRYVLRGWNNAPIPNPFASVAVNRAVPSPIQPPPVGRPLPTPPGQAPRPNRPLPMTPIDAIAAKLNAWIAGTSPRPTNDELDVILLVLQDQANRGPGVGTRVNYDPHKTSANGIDRPPQVALFHELTHAYYNAIGMQLGREDSSKESSGGRLFELMSTGLPPFDQRPISENKFRQAIGVGPRMAYP